MPQFHDPAYDASVQGAGLCTPITIYKKRVYYEIVEFNPLLDSSNMVL